MSWPPIAFVPGVITHSLQTAYSDAFRPFGGLGIVRICLIARLAADFLPFAIQLIELFRRIVTMTGMSWALAAQAPRGSLYRFVAPRMGR